MSARSVRVATLTLGLSALAALPAHAALVVTMLSDPAALTAALLSGGGFSVSNAGLKGAAVQQGSFGGGTTIGGLNGIGLATGVILTSGNAGLAVGPNNNAGAGAQAGSGNSTALSALIGGTTTFDANVLTFTVTPTVAGTLSFQYVFASEEYNELVGAQYDDVFGLFVNDVNYALAPAQNRLSVNTVNCGKSMRDVAPAGPGKNCDLFVNNDFNSKNLGLPFDLQYDGFTTVFTTRLPLVANTPYSISLAIADAADNNGDSAVFIMGAFEQTPVNPISEPGLLLLLGSTFVAWSVAVHQRRRASSSR